MPYNTNTSEENSHYFYNLIVDNKINEIKKFLSEPSIKKSKSIIEFTNAAIILGAEQNNLGLIRFCFDEINDFKVNINANNFYAIHSAFQFKNFDCLNFLLIQVNKQNKDNYFLTNVIQKDNIEFLSYLFSKESPLNNITVDDNHFSNAISFSSVKTFEFLLDKTPSNKKTNDYYCFLLNLAIQCQKYKFVKYLLIDLNVELNQSVFNFLDKKSSPQISTLIDNVLLNKNLKNDLSFIHKSKMNKV